MEGKVKNSSNEGFAKKCEAKGGEGADPYCFKIPIEGEPMKREKKELLFLLSRT